MAKPLTIKTKKPEDVRPTVPVDEVTQGDLVQEVSVADLVRDAIKAYRSK